MTDSGAPQGSGSPQEISVHNQQALEELAWAIEMAQGSFTLILARCSYASLRDRMVEQLRHVCPVTFQVMVLQPSVTALYAAIRDQIGETQPNALMVFGLETVSDLEQLLTLTNQVREEFRKNLPFPLVLWVTDEVHGRLVRSAPDFESWATTTEFAIATPDLLDSLHQAADQLFGALLSPDTALSFRKIVARLELSILGQQELAAALRDLQSREQALEPDLQASLCFFRGVNASISREAVEHLQNSLELWQQVATAIPDSDSALATQLKLGLSLFFLGQCQYYLDGQDKQRSPRQVSESPPQPPKSGVGLIL